MKYMGIVSVLALLTVTGCSAFEKQINKYNNDKYAIKCYPADAVGCIGWVGDKPIMIEEEL